MNLDPTFLFYRTGFAPTNGTSVQMQRLFDGANESLVHLMWNTREAGPDSVRWVVRADDGFEWAAPYYDMGRILRRLKGLVIPRWWFSGKINSARLARALNGIPLRPRQAYVNCYNEIDAGRICALWDAVGRPPFVLHMFDIFHPTISATATPGFWRLIRSARHVLCLNRLIEDEMTRAGARETSLFPLVSDLETSPRTAPDLPLKVLISGALYASKNEENTAMRLLREAWPGLEKLFPQAELHYSGASSRGLPEELRSLVRDHGLLSTEDYQKLLRACHVAYVPVAHLRHTPLRFSMPSRIPDYLLAGLPVIACTEENTGIHEFFQSTPRDCTRLVGSADEFLSALQEFAGDPDRWKQASDSALAYAQGAFALEPARDRLFRLLNQAGSKEG